MRVRERKSFSTGLSRPLQRLCSWSSDLSRKIDQTPLHACLPVVKRLQRLQSLRVTVPQMVCGFEGSGAVGKQSADEVRLMRKERSSEGRAMGESESVRVSGAV
jgi:hypothetical protein